MTKQSTMIWFCAVQLAFLVPSESTAVDNLGVIPQLHKEHFMTILQYKLNYKVSKLLSRVFTTFASFFCTMTDTVTNLISHHKHLEII